jgi:hypothetical protein
MSPLDWTHSPVSTLAITVIFIVLATSAYPTFRLSGASFHIDWGMPMQISSDRHKLIDFLIHNNLRYGYATYWNAGVLSVLSNEKSLVRQVIVGNCIPVPMRHLSSNRWYRPSAWHGETFLLLTKSETDQVDWDQLAAYDVKPFQHYEVDGFKVFVFKENIAELLPGWDTRYEMLTSFLVNKYTLHYTGRLVNGLKENAFALVAEKGESGALHFGPYVNVEPGRYLVEFDVVANYNPAGAIRLDVAAAPDQKLYGERLLVSSDKPQEMIFSLAEMRTMEFRVWALGNTRVIFKGVTIRRLRDGD